MQIYKYGHYALESWKVPDLVGRILPADECILPEYVAFVADPPRAPKNSKVTIHSCIIKGAKDYTTVDGLCLPELAYMQVANSCTDVELIYLGLQLVSGYEGKRPICTIRDIYACASSLEGHHGRSRVLTILPYLCEGSRSPMETLTFMLLSLPVHLGGRGFRDLELNYPIESVAHGKSYVADICWPEKRLVIEYQSQYHASDIQKARDKKRRTILESEGYHVIEVWSEDIHKPKLFEALVLELQRQTGKRVRYRTGKFIENFTRLRDILFSEGRQHTKRASSLVRISWHELPKFPWIWKAYELYRTYHKKLLWNFKNRYSLDHPRTWHEGFLNT